MFYNDNKKSDMSTTERMAIYLLRPYLDKIHILDTENYYTNHN